MPSGAEQAGGLLRELKRLASASKKGGFDAAAITTDNLSGEERELALLIGDIIGNCAAFDKYELKQYRLTDDELGIARWHMIVTDGDTANPNNVFRWSVEFRHMLGYVDESDFPDVLSSWSESLHPEDKERVLSAFRVHVGDSTGATPYNLEYRLRTKAGEYRHFRAVGFTLRDDSGAAIRVSGALEDITERVRQQETLEHILDAMDIYIHITDTETDELMFANRKMAEDFGFDDNAQGNKCWQRLQLGQTERCKFCKKDEIFQNPGEPVFWEDDNPILGKSLFKIDRLIKWPGGREVHMQQGIDVTEMKKARESLKRREEMLDALNRAAIALLSQSGDDFENAIAQGIRIIAGATSLERMSVFRNSERPDGLHMSQIYRWRKDTGTTAPREALADAAYAGMFPTWEAVLKAGELINGPARLTFEANALAQFGCVTVLAIPVFIGDAFWGFTLFENLTEETVFSAHETDMLRSAGLMLANAVIRNEEEKVIRKADEYARLMLDATPLACRLWNRDYRIFECNEAAVRLYGLGNKQEYIDRYLEWLPEYQPDGQRSIDAILRGVTEAFEKGSCVYPIVFRLPDGSPLPAENTVLRVQYGEDFVAAAYTRDLREHVKMMAEIEKRGKELEAALADARAANSAKSSFLATMSHEIRTPLNAVVGLSELALGSEKLDSELENQLDKIHASGMTILSIVNDILDISKIESGKFELYPVEYDTPSLINDIITLNIVRIGEKPIEFKLSLDENLPGTLLGDDLRVKQVFNNLLSNAFKYTHAGTVEWKIGYEICGGDIWLVSSVRDTGIGMSPGDAKNVFSAYNQVDAKTNRKVEGTGLGLTITKRFVELMDGKISVESEYGKGTIFSVRMRQAYVSGAPIGKSIADSLMSLRYTKSKRSSGAKLARVDLSYAHVLVVDDIATNLDVVRGMMKPYGLQIDCASDGPKAIEMIRRGVPRYSAVFMDHMMPDMDGIEATQIIRAQIGTEYAKNIPVIALTANAIVGNEEMFLSQGFQAFLSKPIDMAKLDAILRRWVRDKSKETGEAAPEAFEPGSTGDSPLSGLSIGGLDQEKALERFAGDESVLIDVLRSYAAGTRPIISKLEEYQSSGSLEAYAIAVHGVKGSSYGVCARKAGMAAEHLEAAAKAGDLDAVKRDHPAFVVIMNNLLDELDAALTAIDNQSATAAAPDPALLIEIRDACAAFEMDRVDSAMERLEAYRYESGGELVAWLREKVDGMFFEDIAGMEITEK